ncbi:MAG: PASTA domain-containing protein, partial [Anaerolineae bacterium]|nr:PASTA domain-containing protein [Anaerolineae bacterium]
VPNVLGMGLRDALFILENQGLRVHVVGTGMVSQQSLKANTRFTRGNSRPTHLRWRAGQYRTQTYKAQGRLSSIFSETDDADPTSRHAVDGRLDVGGGLRLLAKTLHKLRVAGIPVAQHFDCHEAIQLHILRLIHRRHAATSDDGQQAIAVVEHGAVLLGWGVCCHCRDSPRLGDSTCGQIGVSVAPVWFRSTNLTSCNSLILISVFVWAQPHWQV